MRNIYLQAAGNRWIAGVSVFLISLGILVTFTSIWGPTVKFYPGGDSDQYLSLGRSLSAGNGYKDLIGPWPNAPDYARMPGWPFVIAVGLKIEPQATPESVARYTNAFCLSCAGVFFCLLTQNLGVSAIFSVLAGLAISLSPAMVFLSVEGLSEVSFLALVGAGTFVAFKGGRWFFVGAFLLGLAPLIRTNFVLVPPVLCGLTFLLCARRSVLLNRRVLLRMAFASALALMPSLLWAVRNYVITGRFPLLSSIEGETLYGANNSYVADNLDAWGYWVIPNEIPGELPKLDLAQKLQTPLALNDYYHQKAVAWMKAHWRELPRLELGKFIRAFVPIPWAPMAASYAVFFYRFLLYALWVALIRFWWPGISRTYLIFCLAMMCVHLVTTAVYYGSYRFTHCYVEVLFVPCIAFGLERWCRLHGLASSTEVESEERLQSITAPEPPILQM